MRWYLEDDSSNSEGCSCIVRLRTKNQRRIKLAETDGRNNLTQRQTLQKRLEEAGPSSPQQWAGKSHRRKGKCVDWFIGFKIYLVLNGLVLSKCFVVST